MRQIIINIDDENKTVDVSPVGVIALPEAIGFLEIAKQQILTRNSQVQVHGSTNGNNSTEPSGT